MAHTRALSARHRAATPVAAPRRAAPRRSAPRAATKRFTAKRAQAEAEAEPVPASDRYYGNWLALPIQPGDQRITTRTELVKGRMWGLEQTQGVLNVLVNVRMTVVKLADGGLLCWCPVAPTRECVRLVEELGEVKYVVLPTTALEHKFPDCEVYIAPGQYSVPLDLPFQWLGLGAKRVDGVLGECELPFADEFEGPEILSLSLGTGTFCEVAMVHKSTKTLLIVDSVVQCPAEPPEVCRVDPSPLLARAKADGREPDREPTPAVLREGWAKTALFGLFFQPVSVEYKPSPAAVVDIDKGFTWTERWKSSFARISNKVFVAPILQQVVLNKRPSAALEWVDRVAAMGFNKVVPAHLQAPIQLSPAQFKAKFAFLRELEAERQAAKKGGAVDEERDQGRRRPAFELPELRLPDFLQQLQGGAGGGNGDFEADDMQFLKDLDEITVKSGFVKLEE